MYGSASASSNKSTDSYKEPPVQDSCACDNISLMDLLATLVKHRKLVIAVTASMLFAGAVLALIKPPKFLYTTVIEIGGQNQSPDGSARFSPIESAESAKSKLEAAYLPLAVRQHTSAQEDAATFPDIKVSLPKNGNTLILEANADRKFAEKILAIQSSASLALVEDHKRLQAVETTTLQQDYANAQRVLDALLDPAARSAKIKGLEAQLESSKGQLLSLNDEKNLLENNLLRLSQHEDLLKSHLKDVESLIKSGNEQRMKSVAASKSGPEAMTQLLIDNQQQQLVAQKISIEEQLQVKLQSERDALRNTRDDLSRRQDVTKLQIARQENELTTLKNDFDRQAQAQRDLLATIKSKIENINSTRVLLPTSQSLRPTGPTPALILALAAFIGLFSGLMSALIAEFRDKFAKNMTENPFPAPALG